MRPDHNEYNHWYDAMLPHVRILRSYMTDTEIVVQLVEGGQATAAQVWLCLNSAEILDGKRS